MFVTKKELERSKLKLVRKTHFKILDKNKTYYLIEKAYMSNHDGFIDVGEITEKEYNNAIAMEEVVKEIKYEEARENIKRIAKELHLH